MRGELKRKVKQMPLSIDLMALKRMGKREVRIIVTFHNNETKTITSYCGKKQKLVAVVTNNKYMGPWILQTRC